MYAVALLCDVGTCNSPVIWPGFSFLGATAASDNANGKKAFPSGKAFEMSSEAAAAGEADVVGAARLPSTARRHHCAMTTES